MMENGLFSRLRGTRKEMSFVDHLEELRWHIVRSILAILVFAVVIFIKIQWVFDHLIAGPLSAKFISYRAFCGLGQSLGLGNKLCLQPPHVLMQTTVFTGQFLGAFSLAFVGGLIIAFPYIFWEFWKFVKPALKPKELNASRFVIFWVSFFFFLGSAFGYLVLAPFTFSFLANFHVSALNLVETKPTFNDYLDTLTTIIIGCGISFEMPVIAYALTKIGIITPSFLRRSRKYAIVIILIVAAFITPSPDWYSQTIVFVPLMSLYEFGVFVSARAYKKMQMKEHEEWS
jgi:sec-independent protein translocase protein TatC